MPASATQGLGGFGLRRCDLWISSRPAAGFPFAASTQPASVIAIAEFGLIASERRKSSCDRGPSLAKAQMAKAAIHSTLASLGARAIASQASCVLLDLGCSDKPVQPWKAHTPR